MLTPSSGACDAEVKFMGLNDAQIAGANFYRGRGCNDCGRTGFKGRCGIYEIFVINDHIREMIYKREPANLLRKAARELGMRTLR